MIQKLLIEILIYLKVYFILIFKINIINIDQTNLFDFTNKANIININQPIQDNFNFNDGNNQQIFNYNNNPPEFNNYPFMKGKDFF